MVMRQGGRSQDVTHAKIVAALEEQNVEAARQALLDEIDTSRDTILDGVMQEEAAYWHLDANRNTARV